jgi:hypothetical protein
MSTKASPAALLANASCRSCGVSKGLRPNRTPRACARLRPSPVRARIKCLSNSANPGTVTISLPCALVVSHQGSPNDLKLAPASAIAARVLSKSRVERARRSSLQTTSVSPGASAAMALARLLSLIPWRRNWSLVPTLTTFALTVLGD